MVGLIGVHRTVRVQSIACTVIMGRGERGVGVGCLVPLAGRRQVVWVISERVVLDMIRPSIASPSNARLVKAWVNGKVFHLHPNYTIGTVTIPAQIDICTWILVHLRIEFLSSFTITLVDNELINTWTNS